MAQQLSGLLVTEGSADGSAELDVMGDDKLHAKYLLHRRKHRVALGEERQVADKYIFADAAAER